MLLAGIPDGGCFLLLWMLQLLLWPCSWCKATGMVGLPIWEGESHSGGYRRAQKVVSKI